MRLKILPRAKKELKKLSKIDQIAVAEKIRGLVKNGLREKKLSGYKNLYRSRVGDCRVVYKKNKDEIYIIMIGHRKNIYEVIKKLLS